MRTLVIAALMFFSLAPAALAQCVPTQANDYCIGQTQPSGGGNVLAPTQPSGGGNVTNVTNVTLINPLKAQNLKAFLKDILAFIIDIGTIVIILMIVYVGYLFVIAQGAPGKIEEARWALLWTVVGALILLGSQAIAISLEATVSAITGP